jgi:cell division protein FtsQ
LTFMRTPADRLVNALYLGAGALLAYAFLSWLVSLSVFALHRIEVRGELRHIQEPGIRLIAARGIRGNFFTVDLDEVREAFEKLPWVREARVSRYWPDTLIVELEEHTPLAHWNGNALLSTEGIVFNATSTARLPSLGGFEGSGEEVADAYRRFSKTLAPAGMQIQELSFSARRAWRLRTEQGLQIALGRIEPDIRLARFARLYGRVVERLGAAPSYVDLRYADGFAVKTPGNPETMNTRS